KGMSPGLGRPGAPAPTLFAPHQVVCVLASRGAVILELDAPGPIPVEPSTWVAHMKEETAMSSNVVFFGWNRSIPGREQMSAQHFQAFTEYLAAQQRSGVIQSFEPVFLTPHGGDLGGFILIRGDNAKLDALLATNEWVEHTLRATM